MKNISKTKNKGFSLIEMLVSIFISVLITLSVTAAFASAFKTQKKARDIQRGVEEAKTALEHMAKIIRMSGSVVKISDTRISMYSKSLGECIRFRFNEGQKRLLREECPIANGTQDEPCADGNPGTDCSGGAYASSVPITKDESINDMKFYVSGNTIERVTIYLEMNDALDSKAKMQTTVSTRDYKNLNPIED